jgi:hypothetical protein
MGFQTRKSLDLSAFVGATLLALLFSSCGSESPTTPPRTACQATPDSIDFGLTVLQHQKLQEVSITNSGNTTLTIEVSPPNGFFGVVFVGDGPLSLPPGSTKRITVTYAPQTVGRHSTLISLGNDVCANIYCKGEGYLDPNEACSITPGTLDYGKVHLEEPVDLSFWVRNIGTLPISGQVAETCGPFDIVAGLGPFTLGPADSLKVTVRFLPTSVGPQACSISLGSAYCSAVPCHGIGVRTTRWYIKPDGSGDAPTIQAGIDSSYDTDTVLVAEGTYYEAINYSGKNILVMSESGPENTILDGSVLEEPIVTFENAETRAAVLEGLTLELSRRSAIVCKHASPVIRNNHILNNLAAQSYETDRGGGILASGSPLIEANLFEANESFGNAGAMELMEGSPIIQGNVFRNNRSAYDGGAIFIHHLNDGSAIESNTFVGNIGGDHGGAIEIGYLGNGLIIEFNIFDGNIAKGNDGPSDSGTGGALSIRGADRVVVNNNTFVFNDAINWATCTGGAILFDGVSACTVLRNIFFETPSCVFSCRGMSLGVSFSQNLFWPNQTDLGMTQCGVTVSASNIVADPIFCNVENGDYRLSLGSPAILADGVIGAFTTPGCEAPGPVGNALRWDTLPKSRGGK